jgi:hypothetical protein
MTALEVVRQHRHAGHDRQMLPAQALDLDSARAEASHEVEHRRVAQVDDARRGVEAGVQDLDDAVDLIEAQ